VINKLKLEDIQKEFLRARWLDQVTWMEGRADRDQRLYYTLRLIAIIGGVIVPALATLSLDGGFGGGVRWATFGVSLVVAISIAVEEFFHYGDRWRHYRRTVEWLKVEGWQFFQLSGPYRRFMSHHDAYTEFATRAEDIIQSDIEKYITRLAGEVEKGAEESQSGPRAPG
jgi:hypothetical protein